MSPEPALTAGPFLLPNSGWFRFTVTPVVWLSATVAASLLVLLTARRLTPRLTSPRRRASAAILLPLAGAMTPLLFLQLQVLLYRWRLPAAHHVAACLGEPPWTFLVVIATPAIVGVVAVLCAGRRLRPARR